MFKVGDKSNLINFLNKNPGYKTCNMLDGGWQTPPLFAGFVQNLNLIRPLTSGPPTHRLNLNLPSKNSSLFQKYKWKHKYIQQICNKIIPLHICTFSFQIGHSIVFLWLTEFCSNVTNLDNILYHIIQQFHFYLLILDSFLTCLRIKSAQKQFSFSTKTFELDTLQNDPSKNVFSSQFGNILLLCFRSAPGSNVRTMIERIVYISISL